MKSSLVILLISLIPGFAAPPSVEDSLRDSLLYRAKLMERLSTVSSKGGISRDEAIIIGENFAERYVNCGGFTGVSDDGEFWIVHNAVGYFGRPDESTRVAKIDGLITSELLRGKDKVYFYRLWNL